MKGDLDENWLDGELKKSLARRAAPPGFVDRVMARIPEQRKQPRRFLTGLPIAAAVAMAILGGGYWEYKQEETVRIHREQAKAELVYALELTSAKLQHTRARLMKKSGEL